MTDVISLALSTGLGPVLAVVVILIFMGLAYKMAGKIPAIMVGIVSTFALMVMDFIPLFWGMGIIFAIVAGLVLGGGWLDGD